MAECICVDNRRSAHQEIARKVTVVPTTLEASRQKMTKQGQGSPSDCKQARRRFLFRSCKQGEGCSSRFATCIGEGFSSDLANEAKVAPPALQHVSLPILQARRRLLLPPCNMFPLQGEGFSSYFANEAKVAPPALQYASLEAQLTIAVVVTFVGS